MAPWRNKTAKSPSEIEIRVNSSRTHSPTHEMHHQLECIAQASACREKAQADPARYDYWIDEAVMWHQRAIHAGSCPGHPTILTAGE
jgi:hypothetical protein